MHDPAGGRRRDGSLWAVAAGLAATVAVGLLVDARTGAYVLAGVLAIGALVRAVAPSPGPVALAVRARWLDVTVLTALAAGVATLAAIVPTPA